MLFKLLQNMNNMTLFFNNKILNDAQCILNLRYDKILLSPGVYDEQIEISSKIPFEIVGEGELGQVLMLLFVHDIRILAKVHLTNSP